MENCEHTFHKDCIKKYFQVQMDQNMVPFKCPIQGCKKDVSQIVVESILSAPQRQKYHEKQMDMYASRNKDMSRCPTPDCKYMFFFQAGDSTDFSCLLCSKRYCLDCRTPFHNGMTCA